VLFGKWMNSLPTLGAIGAFGGLCAVIGGFWYYATPKYWRVGYMPTQPGYGFNHQLHAGKLGIDCRYCHTKVETSPEANIPNVATCFGCHAENHVSSLVVADDKVKFIRDAFVADEPIAWRRVHKLPDYVRNFPHNIHIRAGVSCFSCHGQIMGLPIVAQIEPLSMGWCLDCHREMGVNPEKRIVPADKVTNLHEVQEHFQFMAGNKKIRDPFSNFNASKVVEDLKVAAPENCGACHY
jgi:hypothetical protein